MISFEISINGLYNSIKKRSSSYSKPYSLHSNIYFHKLVTPLFFLLNVLLRCMLGKCIIVNFYKLL